MPDNHDGSLPLEEAELVVAGAEDEDEGTSVVLVGTGASEVVVATQDVVSTQDVLSTHDEVVSVGATQLVEGVTTTDDVSTGTELPKLPTALVAEGSTLDEEPKDDVRADVATEAETATELLEKSDTDVADAVLLAGAQRLPRLRLRFGLGTTSGTFTSSGSASWAR